jgi:hypothetical protein
LSQLFGATKPSQGAQREFKLRTFSEPGSRIGGDSGIVAENSPKCG